MSLTHHSASQCIAGTDTWQRVNTGMPVKSPRFALFDLAEDRSYSFRVRCCNSAGVSEASAATEEITVGDKLGESFILLGHQGIQCMKSTVHSDSLQSSQYSSSSLSIYLLTSTDLPSTPGNPVAIRNTDTSVVVTWGASKEVKQLVGYYIECSEVGTDVWMPCNNKPVKQTRYARHKEVRNDSVTHWK